MRKILFIVGIGLIAVWAWDEIAFQVDKQTGTNTMPFTPFSTILGGAIPEFYAPIAGAALVTYLAVTG